MQHGQPGLLKALFSAAFWCQCCRRCSLLRDSRQLLVNQREKGKEMKGERTDMRGGTMSTLSLSLYTQALVKATGTGGGGGGIHSLSRATKGQSENPAFLGGSGHDGKATCSFQSACARPVPSNLVRALKKKQQGRVRGEKAHLHYFVRQQRNLLSLLTLIH